MKRTREFEIVANTIDLHIYLPVELVDEIKRVAARDCRSVTKQVEWFVREGMRCATEYKEI